MTRTTLGICALVMATLLSACGAATATPTSAPTAASTSAPTTAPADAAAPTSLDPCQVITSQEASTLAGATFGAGDEATTPGGGKTCTYGAQTANVFTVEVGQASDVDSAKAYKADFEAELKAKAQELANGGLKVTELPDFADGGVTGQLNVNVGGETINGSAFGFLKGRTFVGFSDVVVGNVAPSSEALQAEAQTLLGQLP